MGTNFYLIDKNEKERYDKLEKIIDNLNLEYPDADIIINNSSYYRLHIAKTSCGWKPMFQAHLNKIEGMEELKSYYNSNKNIEIVDEYGEIYNWDEFEKRVIQHEPLGESHYDCCNLNGYNTRDMFKDCNGFTWDYSDFS